MKELIAYLNGEFIPDFHAKIHYSDSWLAFGHVVTESTRTFKLEPFKLREHIERLYKSMRVVRIDPLMSPEEMEKVSLQGVELNRAAFGPNDDVWIVHNVSGGRLLKTIGKWEFDRTTVLITYAAIAFTAFAHFYETGVHAVTPSVRQIPPQCLDPKIKHRNRMHFTLAEFQVKEVDPEGFSILLDLEGNIAENKGANFFIVSDGVLRTPTCHSVLRGISRTTVLELAEELGIKVVEEDIQPYDVQTADEAFFTSTPYCLLPATRFNGAPIGDGKIGPIVRKLLASWSKLVGVDIVAQALSHLKK